MPCWTEPSIENWDELHARRSPTHVSAGRLGRQAGRGNLVTIMESAPQFLPVLAY